MIPDDDDMRGCPDQRHVWGEENKKAREWFKRTARRADNRMTHDDGLRNIRRLRQEIENVLEMPKVKRG